MSMATCRAGVGGGSVFVARWSGLRFVKGTEESEALLGTPYGKGIVYLLVNHPDELHDKNIEAITVFTTDEGISDDQHLLFTLTG